MVIGRQQVENDFTNYKTFYVADFVSKYIYSWVVGFSFLIKYLLLVTYYYISITYHDWFLKNRALRDGDASFDGTTLPNLAQANQSWSNQSLNLII